MIRDAKFLIKLQFRTMKEFRSLHNYNRYELEQRIERWDSSGHSGDKVFNSLLDNMYKIKCKELNIDGIRVK